MRTDPPVHFCIVSIFINCVYFGYTYFLKLFKCLIEFFAIILPHCKDYYYNFSEDVVLSDLLKNKAVNKSEKRNAHFPLSSLAFRSILKSLKDWTINLAASVWTLKQAIHCYL